MSPLLILKEPPVPSPNTLFAGQKERELQIIFGLLCNAAGCPIAVEVFEGNVNDAKTLSPVLEKVRHRFGFNG
jgi:hypothetical protein